MLRLRTPLVTGSPQAQNPPSPRRDDGQTVEETPRGQQMLDGAPVTWDNAYRTLEIRRPLHLHSDDVALAMHYSSYCIDFSAVWSPEQIQTQGNGCLFSAIKVLGNISRLQRWSLPDGSATVWKDYSDAIQLLNSALASPLESRTDSTLLATMIMGAIETKAAPSRSFDYWEMHTKGAAALLQLRGPNQVTSRLGSALFFQTSSYMTTVCILSGQRIPEDLHRLRNATNPLLVDPAHPLWKYQGAMFRITDFAAATRTDVSQLEDQEIQHIIVDALNVYEELQAVFSGADAAWQYDRIPSARFSSLVDHEHVYQTQLATQLWNGYRTAVVILCTVVARIAKRLPSQVCLDDQAQAFLNNAAYIINQVAVDTIAAVPRPPAALGSSHNPGYGSYARHAPVFQETQPDSQAVPYMHGCPLQWSVYFAANCEFIEPRVRECLLDILENAAKAMEIQQWKISAEKLRLELRGVPK
jgi:hypothetical protein